MAFTVIRVMRMRPGRYLLVLTVVLLLISSTYASGVIVSNRPLEVRNGQFILTDSTISGNMVPAGSYSIGSSSSPWADIFISGSLYSTPQTSYYVNPAGRSELNLLHSNSISVGVLSVSGSAFLPIAPCNYLATDSSGKIVCSPYDGNTVTGSGTQNYIPKWTGSTTLGNSQIYDNSTNVGIGTTSPAAKLDVAGEIRAQNGISIPGYSGTTSWWGWTKAISISSASGPQYRAIVYTNPANNKGWMLGFHGYGDYFAIAHTADGWSSGSIYLYVNGSGNVGIGTTSPGAKLDVAGEIGGTKFTDRDNTGYYLDPASTSKLYNLLLNSGTLYGNFDLNLNSAVRITDGSHYATLIQPYGPYAYGFGVYIQSGGQMIIGSGESASTTYTNVHNAGNETMYVTSDGPVKLISGLQSDWNSRYSVILNGQNFYPERDNNINLGTSSNRWKSVYSLSGSFTAVTSSVISASGSILAPTYYVGDSNTALSKGSNNALRVATPAGYVDIGSQNSSWAHFITDRPAFYFNKSVAINGTLRPYSDNATDLGTSSARWRNAYVAGTVYVGAVRWGNNSLITGNQGGSIELGGDNSTAGVGTPYIDFHYNGSTSDYDVRLRITGPDVLSVEGGTLRLATRTNCSKLYTDSSGNILCGTDNAGVTGSGTQNYIPKWTGSTTLGNSQIYDNSTNVGIGTTSPAAKLHIYNGYLRVEGAAVPTPNGGYLTLGGEANSIIMSFPRIASSNDNAFLRIFQSGTSDYDLRLYLQDDQDDSERFSIWGGSCSNGGCSQGTANAIVQHYFTAAGNAYHRGTLRVGSKILAPIYYDSGNTGYYLDPAATSRLNAIYANDVYLQKTVLTVPASTSQWYRIAQSPSNASNNAGIFEIRWAVGGAHGHVYFIAGANFGNANGIVLNVLSTSRYGSETSGVTKIRILENGTYDPMYLEIYVSNPNSSYGMRVEIRRITGYGWSLITPTTGSIPSGYVSHEISTSDVALVVNEDSKTFVVKRSTGNVGIGTTSPAAKLDVNGSILSRSRLYVTNLFSINPFVGSYRETRVDLNPYQSDSTSDVFVTLFRETNTTGKKALVLYAGNGTPTAIVSISVNGDSYFNGGNVGIGTTSPGAKLDVAGEIRGTKFTDRDNPSYYIDLSNTTTSISAAGAIRAPSIIASTLLQAGDLKFKNNFRVVEDGNDALVLLNPQGKPIMKIDANGDIWIRGKIHQWK